ncbi:nuclease PA3 [Zopfia rhizophila CBS 207.26]|uniref:Nuclease PA3 n=1 Tax=Zopfia rhizophila CBS 207.26 TaxID=1314779 RepID=A0A6A6D9L4_9PEZI|nr:nuclease PA3 [Zopfia rhizophila CBS 207.26]
MRIHTILSGSLLLTATAAWNTDVHNQIGFMAEEFLNPYTTSILQQILEPQYNGSIGRATAWADAYAHTEEGKFSYQWHWIDSSDDPPLLCDISYVRDCSKGGCVVSAISNQTHILKSCIDNVRSGNLRGGTNLTCSYALKWVSHFLGDVAQPLHASGRAAGGNRINVTFGGVSTELHAVWDGYIPYSDANVTQFSNLSISPFFTSLVSRIRENNFSEPTSQWLSCTDPSAPLACAFAWARESNALTCNYVYNRPLNNTDLATSGYAEGAYPIVELQISKAALRLGTWLNRLVERRYNPNGQVILKTNPSWADGSSGAQ